MRILKTDSFAENKDLAGVRRQFAGENIYQGAFTGTVFTQERVDFALMQDEVHTFQRLRIAKAFADAAREDDGMITHL